MKIKICHLTTRKKSSHHQLCDDYLKRLPSTWQVRFHPILTTHHKSQNTQDVLALEYAIIQKHLDAKDYVIAMDAKGQMLDTLTFSQSLVKFAELHQQICFVIGSAFGLSGNFLKNANAVWSLSRLTMPHALAQLLLVEQIYRSCTITTNHPYNK